MIMQIGKEAWITLTTMSKDRILSRPNIRVQLMVGKEVDMELTGESLG